MLHIIHDVKTNTIEKVPYTEAEILEAEKAGAVWEKEQALRDAEEKTKADAKAAVLAKLGLTADEVAALLG